VLLALIFVPITNINFICVQKCVFLMYNSLHKGYKCLDRDIGHVSISRDIIFYESVFLYLVHPIYLLH
jgi:hypothetical protein